MKVQIDMTSGQYQMLHNLMCGYYSSGGAPPDILDTKGCYYIF